MNQMIKKWLTGAAKLSAVLLIAMHAQTATAGEEKSGSFSGVSSIKLGTVSGDLIVTPSTSGDVEVRVESSYNPENVEMILQQDGDTLRLKEKFHANSSRGSSTWYLALPENVELNFASASGGADIRDVTANIKVSTASGDIEAQNLIGNLSGNTASGDLLVTNITGDVKLNTASGDVEAFDLRGKASLSTASGNVEAKALMLNGKGEFSSASGDVEVSLTQPLMDELSLSSASGAVDLNLNGNGLQGHLVMSTRRDYDIRAPYTEDAEETYTRNGKVYVKKSYNLGSGPAVKISSSTGDVSVHD